LLARQILALEDPTRQVPGVSDPEVLVRELVEAARLEVDKVDRNRVFQDVSDENETIPEKEIRLMLVRSGQLALAGLLTLAAGEKEAGHAAD
jgi:hypothetical protein